MNQHTLRNAPELHSPPVTVKTNRLNTDPHMCLDWPEFNLDNPPGRDRGFMAAVVIVYTEAQQPSLRVTKVYPCGLTVRNNPNKGWH